MNCSEVHELLSAYYDGELFGAARTELAEHVGDCERCSQKLKNFARLSQMAAELTTPAAPAGTWRQLERKLAAGEAPAGQMQSSARAEPVSSSSWRWMALAAMVLVTAGLGGVGFFQHDVGQQERHVASDFGHYLELFERDPHEAQQMLLARYNARPVKTAEAGRYSPASQRLPAGYRAERAYVWEMPCCSCTQTLCRRDDGSTIAIFEHAEQRPGQSGSGRTGQTQCSGEDCCLTQVESPLAASWNLGSRYVTVVGFRDLGEVEELAASLAQESEKRPL